MVFIIIRGGGARSLVIGETQIIQLENHMTTVLEVHVLLMVNSIYLSHENGCVLYPPFLLPSLSSKMLFIKSTHASIWQWNWLYIMAMMIW